ncbi:MAG: ABC transporter ATP-binding protein, partial [Gemmobacter sp.]|nr:ABC transporter ATP-binding protein [Gemmobacter sp.]
RGVAVIFITHDLALASEYCDRALDMNAGRIVEEGPATRIFTDPQHPYTRALLDALPYGKTDASELRPMEWEDPDAPKDGATS